MRKRNVMLVVSDYDKPYDDSHILQMVSKAKDLASVADMKVGTVCIGSESLSAFEQLASYGSDAIVFCNEEEQRDFRSLSDILATAFTELEPAVVLFPATEYGKAMAAILSTRFGAGLTAECIDVSYNEDGDFDFTRAAMNHSVIAKINCINCELGMCTVKKGVFAQIKQTESSAYELIPLAAASSPVKEYDGIKVLTRTICATEPTIDIEKANIVFCVGRGVKDAQMLERIYHIAEQCGAEVAGTRAVVEMGLIEKERQVGQSGKSISPHIYVALGISGASQHIVGIKNADIVIAVDHDPKANIFNYADYIIVEDIGNIIEALEQLFAQAA